MNRQSTAPPPSPAPAADSTVPVAQFGTSAREVVVCRVCGRTLLMGERSIGYFTRLGDGPYDVCELCTAQAGRFGLRPHPSTPEELSRSSSRRRPLARLRSLLAAITRRGGSRGTVPLVTDLGSAPIGVAALPTALAAFNQSSHARTLAGLHKTLGAPRASVVPRSPTDREVILTVAWEIVWYQFRIKPDGEIHQNRGTYLADLPGRWRHWNCTVSPAGAVSAPSSTAGGGDTLVRSGQNLDDEDAQQ